MLQWIINIANDEKINVTIQIQFFSFLKFLLKAFVFIYIFKIIQLMKVWIHIWLQH